ncbi:protein FAM161A [Onychostruthus taczanowskii]|uniref:protein FAM161A n=1 Tax=Onychostruthus taczanowskii TaxID=356909 RepID=UPI001B80E342|nr:protein FAM161A [Onychostruthus taczanowskii]
MEDAHRAARLAASCLRTPLDPRTRAPAALYERGPPPAAAQDGFDLDSNTKREQASPPKRDCDKWTDFSKMHNSNQEYYLKLEELKNAHMETMAKLESMYQNKLYLKGVQALDKTNDTSPKCCRPTWDKSSYQPLNLHKSFSDSDLSDPLGSSVSDVSDEELVFEENGSEAGSSSFAKQQIEKMWDGFCLEDYMSRAKHSLPSSPACRKAKVKAWSPRVTVPKPFQMTIREAQKKEQNVKSKSQIELENHLLKKQLEEEAECQKKFRANPVPATVFLPLYRDIVRRNEERRRTVRERSKLRLLATQKPFKFIERERQRREARKMQLKDLSPPDNKTKVFRAKPVPRCVYSPDFHDKVKEEELCREIRIRMRAEELLQNSSVPNSRLASKETNKKKKHKSTEPKQTEHKLKIKSSVPDFELLHEKFQKRLLRQKKVKPLTVCEPFDLCTSYIPSKKDKILKDMQEDEEKLKETRWPFASPRRKPQMGQSGVKPPLLAEGKSRAPKTTESTRRRLQALRNSLEEKRKLEEQQKRNRNKQKQRTKKFQKIVMARAEANDPHQSLAQMSKPRLKTFRNNEKQRRQEYLQELQEMEERVKQMPLLFERVTQRNARIAAEKYYSNRLRALGICPEFVSKKGGAAKSLQFSTAGDVTSIAGRARVTKVKMKKMELFEEAAGGRSQSEQSWEEEEEEEEGKGVKTSTPDEQGSDLEDGGEARGSPGVLEPESSWHSDQEEEEEAKADLSLGHSQEEEEEEEEEEAKAGPSYGHSQEEEEEEEAKAGPCLDHSQEEEEEEEAKAGPSRGHSQEEEEDECRPRSDGSHEEEAQSDPETEGAFQYEDEEYESDDSEEEASDEEGH